MGGLHLLPTSPMTRLLTWLLLSLPLLAHAQNGLRTPVTLCNLKPMMSAASYPSGATHYWKFENNLNDSVGAFTLVEGDGGYDSFVSGKKDLCAEMVPDGFLGTDANNLPTASAYSMVMWVFIATGSSFDFRAGATLSIVVTTSGGVDIIAQGGVTSDTLTAVGYTADAWNLIVLTFDGSSALKLSLNGAAFQSGTVTVEDLEGPGLLRCGPDVACRYDECSFFDRALTITEIGNIWNGGTGRFGP